VSDRIERIRERLTRELAPQQLDVLDESHQHKGHAGAQDGRGHYRVRIVSSRFAGAAPLARHRMVYSALGDMMTTDIHALALDARAPEDNKPDDNRDDSHA
jgi:BolA protein